MSASREVAAGFFVVPFGIDGEALGTGFWELSKLSLHWLGFCKNHLTSAGPVFDTSPPDKLSHIRVKCSSASGAAVLTFFVNGKTLASVVLLSGQSPAVDADVAQMFVESLRRTIPVKLAAGSAKPFEKLLTAKERPLMAVVPWPDDTVDDDADELVRELGLHFAGAFFAAH